MSYEAKAGDIGHRVDSKFAIGSLLLTVGWCNHFRCFLVQGRHGRDGGVDPFLFCRALFDCGRDDTCAERFGEEKAIACLCAFIGEDALGMNDAGDGVSEFRFVVANAVAADHGASSFHHFGKAASEDAFEDREVGFSGKQTGLGK